MKEVSHKKINIIQFYLHDVPRVVKFLKTEGRMVVARPWGWGEVGMGSYHLVDIELQFGIMKSSGN